MYLTTVEGVESTVSSKQTRRSISFRYWAKARIEMFAKDQGMTTSAYVESVVANRLGAPSPEEVAAYTPPNSPEIGQESLPVPKRPTANQPKPEPKPAEADDEDVPPELKHYVKPILFF